MHLCNKFLGHQGILLLFRFLLVQLLLEKEDLVVHGLDDILHMRHLDVLAL